MDALQMIRLIGTEFSSMSDSEVEQWIEMVRPMVSRKQFGKLYNQAIALLVCHRMKMVGYGTSPLGGGVGDVGTSTSVASVSDGGTSISFNSGAGQFTFVDAELTMTSYGIQFIQLRKLCIVPIHISGEQYNGT